MTTVNSGDTVILISSAGQTIYVYLGPKKGDGAYVAYVSSLTQGYPVTPLTITGAQSGPIQPNVPFYLTTTAADGLVRYFAPVPGSNPEFTTTASPITITNSGQI